MAPKRKASNDEGSKSSRRTKTKSDETTEDEDLQTKAAPSKKSKKESGDTAKDPETQETSQQETDFTCDAKTSGGEPWNLKITSWNINGIRAWLNKDGLSFLDKENPDVLCLQETKCPDSKIPPKIKNHHGYHCFWLSGDAEGYSGVGLLSKTKPAKVTYGIGIEKHDKEGRCITAEYEHFYLVATYVPNAGRGLVRLEYRLDWDQDFRAYLQQLDSKKPVILCGDLNVAHKEIDLKNPKTNTKNAGFTKEERESFTKLLEESNFVDSFRHLYPDRTGAYTFWTYMMNARAKNVGWRLDYFVLSKSLLDNLCENAIRSQVMGSDHCPITLFMSFKK